MPEGKICVTCGKDVATLKRTKDQKGNYWCMDCYETAVAAHKAKAEAPVPPGVPAASEADLTVQLVEEAADYQRDVCPNCRSPMVAGAAMCVNCGFNPDSGRQAHTKVKREKAKKSSGFKLWPGKKSS